MTVVAHWRTGSHTDGHSHSAIVDAHDGSLLAICVSVEVADLLVRVLNQDGTMDRITELEADLARVRGQRDALIAHEHVMTAEIDRLRAGGQ